MLCFAGIAGPLGPRVVVSDELGLSAIGAIYLGIRLYALMGEPLCRGGQIGSGLFGLAASAGAFVYFKLGAASTAWWLGSVRVRGPVRAASGD